jgi:NDP-sugar pyrophosphorylase family protein
VASRRQWRTWRVKRRWYERNQRPRRRRRIDRHAAEGGFFIRYPVEGEAPRCSRPSIGVGCVVTGGVEIGERCVIGANSVVTRDIPPHSIAAGAPAQVIRPIEYEEPQPTP